LDGAVKDDNEHRPDRSSGWIRPLGLRLGAVVVGLLAATAALALLEGLLRLTGIGAGAPRYDPFAGFSSVVPIFEPGTSARGQPVMVTAAAHRVPVRQEFPVTKAPGTFRAFVIGESSAAGVPYPATYAFSAWLQKRLAWELPQLHVEIVNAGISGYSTRRMTRVVDEVLQYQPDAIIVYAGHNEFAAKRFYAHLMDMDPRLFRIWETLAGTRLFAVATRIPAFRPSPPQIRFDDLNNGLQMFAVGIGRNRSKQWATPREREWVALQFRFNLELMATAAQRAGVRCILVGLGQNFADWAPGGSSHRAGLTPEALASWEAAVADGDRLRTAGDLPGAVAAYRRALVIDDGHADLHFSLANVLRAQGDIAAARAEYYLASDLDGIPLGAPTSFNEVLREVADEHGAVYVDPIPALEAASPDGLLGDALFPDLFHPNLRAGQAIAAAIAAGMQGAGIPVPAAQWRAGYVDPDPESVYAAMPELRAKDYTLRAITCALAQRRECVLEASAAARAIAPNPDLDRLEQGAARLPAP
jgi:lysophospholipase L1-like esterase